MLFSRVRRPISSPQRPSASSATTQKRFWTPSPQSVVDQLGAKGGSLDSAQNAFVQELAGAAGKKLDGVNTDGLLDDLKGEVVAAGLGKLDGISTDGIVSQVTAALIAEAKAQIAKLNLEQLAKGLIASVDIDKLVEEKLAKVDLNAIISKAVADKLGGSGSGGLGGLLGLLTAGN